MTITNGAGSIRDRIELKIDSLGQKQRLVAAFCLANSSQLLFGTAVEVSAAAGVDPATVVRFAQNLGFKGFPEFREALRAEYPMLRPHSQLIEDELTQTGNPDLADLSTIITRVQERSMANLEATYARLDAAALNNVVEAFLGAGRVIVVGAGQSEVLALHLRRLLQLAGIVVDPISDWYDFVYAVSSFKETDVIFATTVWHYSAVTIQTLASAREAGARVILLTDEPFSPAASYADIPLYYAPRAVGEYLSPFAGVALIDALAAVLAMRVPDRVKRGMEMQSAIAKHHGLSIS